MQRGYLILKSSKRTEMVGWYDVKIRMEKLPKLGKSEPGYFFWPWLTKEKCFGRLIAAATVQLNTLKKIVLDYLLLLPQHKICVQLNRKHSEGWFSLLMLLLSAQNKFLLKYLLLNPFLFPCLLLLETREKVYKKTLGFIFPKLWAQQGYPRVCCFLLLKTREKVCKQKTRFYFSQVMGPT